MSSAARWSLRWMSIIALTVIVTACGKSAEQTPAPAPEKTAPTATVLDGVIANKARAQQQTERAMEQNKEKLDAAMKQIDEPPPAP